MMLLPRSFYARNTLVVARELLGKYLIFAPRDGVRMVGKIVETEAYCGPQDKACHASWRRRESCEALWGSPGFAYVYFTYGMYHMLNVVTEKDDFPAAVLIRALEPVEGLAEMLSSRAIKRYTTAFKRSDLSEGRTFKELTSGPGRLTQAFGINYKKHNGLDLTKGKILWVEDCDEVVGPREVMATTRVGVDYAGDWAKRKWRFYIKGSPFVSKK